MKKEWIINGSLSLASLLMFVGVIELGLRITGLQTVKPNPPKIYVRDENPHINYKLKPNLSNESAYKATVSTDELGLRLNKRTKDMIILGDSIAFGYGVHDSETLAAYLGGINAAVPGYQLEQQRALYENYASEVTHNAVMIVFFWNDLDGGKPGILDDNGILRPNGWKPSDDNRPWLERNSAFYKAFRRLLNLRASKKGQVHERKLATEEAKDPVRMEYLDKYVSDLKAFAQILPKDRIFVIWPDNFLHEDTKPIVIAGALAAGFEVIDLYELFGNQVETLSWDTVHPSAESIKQAAEFINLQR